MLLPAFGERLAYTQSMIGWHASRSAFGVTWDAEHSMPAHDMRAAADLIRDGVDPTAAYRMTSAQDLCTMTTGQLSRIGLPVTLVPRPQTSLAYGLQERGNCLGDAAQGGG